MSNPAKDAENDDGPHYLTQEQVEELIKAVDGAEPETARRVMKFVEKHQDPTGATMEPRAAEDRLAMDRNRSQFLARFPDADARGAAEGFFRRFPYAKRIGTNY
ncbi:MAG: hypothetical protein ACREHV_00655 [Rhizomicrobium sp.]